MTDRIRAAVLLLAAALLIVGACAHAVMGWTFVREALGAQQSEAGLTAVLSAGWQLGSVSLLAYGLLVLLAGLARWRGQPIAPATLWVVAAALAGYGAGALLLGDRNFFYFYCGYVILGILLALGVAPSTGRASG